MNDTTYSSEILSLRNSSFELNCQYSGKTCVATAFDEESAWIVEIEG